VAPNVKHQRARATASRAKERSRCARSAACASSAPLQIRSFRQAVRPMKQRVNGSNRVDRVVAPMRFKAESKRPEQIVGDRLAILNRCHQDITVDVGKIVSKRLENRLVLRLVDRVKHHPVLDRSAEVVAETFVQLAPFLIGHRIRHRVVRSWANRGKLERQAVKPSKIQLHAFEEVSPGVFRCGYNELAVVTRCGNELRNDIARFRHVV